MVEMVKATTGKDEGIWAVLVAIDGKDTQWTTPSESERVYV